MSEKDNLLISSIDKGIADSVANGFLVEVAPGRYKLTELGIKHAEDLMIERRKPERPLFKQDMFEFFASEHDLTLTDTQMNDIIYFVHRHYPEELENLSWNELFEKFELLIKEMNRRKEKDSERARNEQQVLPEMR